MASLSKLKSKPVLMGIALAVVAGLFGYLGAGAKLGGGHLPFSLPFGAREGSATGQAQSAEKGTTASYRQMALEPLVINLADPGGRRYLRVTISLEYTDAGVEKDMERVGYRVRDALIQALRAKTVQDLAPDRTAQVRRELLATVNRILGGNKVTGLYFQEFIIQ